MNHWTILGCGVVGLCIAIRLAEQGEKIELIEDKNRQSASWFAGGMLAPWCECEGTRSDFPLLGKKSIEWWEIQTSQVVKKGTLVIALPQDRGQLNRFARMTQEYSWVIPGEIEPTLKDHFQSGLFFPQEAHLDPRKTLTEMRNKLLRYGAYFHSIPYKPTGRIIDCRGIHATCDVPFLRAVRGEMLILHSNDVYFSRPIRLLHPRFPCYLVPRENGYLMLGATMIESSDNSAISARAVMELLSAAYSIHPALAEARVVETGVGLRPAYLSNLPKIYYQNGNFYLNGMYRHGFLLAPIISERLMKCFTRERNL